MSEAPEDHGPCPLCGRTIPVGPAADRHHWVPRAKGGRDWSWLHRVCHRKIHSLFTEAELARLYPTAAALLGHPEIRRFVAWVRKRPIDFYDPSAEAGRKKR